MSTLPRLEYHLINAFTTDNPHSGNQAAVVLFASDSDPRANSDDFLLTTAQDFGFSETAYLVPIDRQAGRWSLRWFTIYHEVPICGHATLAAAKVILSTYPDLMRRIGGVEDPNSLDITISLSTLPKPALDKLVEGGARNLQEMADPLATALGIRKEQILGVGEFKYNDKSLIVEVDEDVDLARLKVDPKALIPYAPDMTVVTQMQPGSSSPGRLRTDSRVYCEDFEDPVTGSAHAFLTGYYFLTPVALRLPAIVRSGQAATSDLALDARQLSARGGKLLCELQDGGMVDISGTASDWGQGSLTSWQ